MGRFPLGPFSVPSLEVCFTLARPGVASKLVRTNIGLKQ